MFHKISTLWLFRTPSPLWAPEIVHLTTPWNIFFAEYLFFTWPQSPTLYMHRRIFNQIQGDLYAYFWTSFWVYLPPSWLSILQFKSLSSPQMSVSPTHWISKIWLELPLPVPHYRECLQAENWIDCGAHLICLPSLLEHNSVLANVWK